MPTPSSKPYRRAAEKPPGKRPRQQCRLRKPNQHAVPLPLLLPHHEKPKNQPPRLRQLPGKQQQQNLKKLSEKAQPPNHLLLPPNLLWLPELQKLLPKKALPVSPPKNPLQNAPEQKNQKQRQHLRKYQPANLRKPRHRLAASLHPQKTVPFAHTGKTPQNNSYPTA